MQPSPRRLRNAALFLVLAALPGAAALAAMPQSAPTVRVEGADVAVLRAAAQLRGAGPSASPALLIELPPLDAAAERRLPPTRPMPLRVGSVRPLADRYTQPLRGDDLQWSPAQGGGFTSTVGVRSPGALAVRMSVLFAALPDGAEVRFFSPDAPGAAQGPFDRAILLGADLPFWSSSVDGERVAMEIWVADAPAHAALELTLGDIGHLWNDPIRPLRFEDIGDSQPCEVDIACWPAWINEIGLSVAKYVFNDGRYLYLCTGTLMNDSQPGSIPYFLTAAHCVSNATDARTMEFYWRFQRASCNGSPPNQLFRTTGGATLLYTSGDVTTKGSTDHSLLRLAQSPPGEYVLSGWDIREATRVWDRKIVHGLHHPSGDLKMASKGKTTGFRSIVGRADGSFSVSTAKPWTHYQVTWKKGVTEGGSSGSGLWGGKSFARSWLIGLLTGGGSYCTDRRAPDYYGRFDVAWRNSSVIRNALGR